MNVLSITIHNLLSGYIEIIQLQFLREEVDKLLQFLSRD